MKFTEYPQGSPNWVDLATTDLAASVAFYSALFGWQGETSPDPQYGGYTIMHLGDDAVAGAGPVMMPGQPVAWTQYLAVDDADATVAAAQAAGGTILAPAMTVGDQGRMAILADPTGAAFGIWQKLDFAGAQVANEADTWSWSELRSLDPEAAAAFYTTVFGLRVESVDMGGMPYYLLKIGDKSVGGLMGMAGIFPPGVPSHWHVYFTVADVEATAAKAGELGGTVLGAAQEQAGAGRWIPLADPQGAQFSIIQ
jgi:predicted enzyme related to lactoylglutathione lyase